MEAATAPSTDAKKTDDTNTGRIEEIQGVVIDAVFPDQLPEINSAITIERPEGGTLIKGDDVQRLSEILAGRSEPPTKPPT